MKIAVAGTGYVGLSIATLLSQHHEVMAVDIIPGKVDLMTFPIWKEDNAIFTSQADIHFFEVLKLKMDSKEVDGVEVILIYDDKKLLDSYQSETMALML